MLEQSVKLSRLIIFYFISNFLIYAPILPKKPLLFAVFSFLEQFFSSSTVVSVAKENVFCKCQPLRFLLETGQERIQILCHLDGAFDWLSVSFFVY